MAYCNNPQLYPHRARQSRNMGNTEPAKVLHEHDVGLVELALPDENGPLVWLSWWHRDGYIFQGEAHSRAARPRAGEVRQNDASYHQISGFTSTAEPPGEVPVWPVCRVWPGEV